jgi:hypothetical protein
MGEALRRGQGGSKDKQLSVLIWCVIGKVVLALYREANPCIVFIKVPENL